MSNTKNDCKDIIMLMLKNSQTKVIFPIITYGLLKEYVTTGNYEFKDADIRKLYNNAVTEIQVFLGHKLHTGGKYYDAYPVRNLPRYNVLHIRGKVFEITDIFKKNAEQLIKYIPSKIKEHIDLKIGVIPSLINNKDRLILADNPKRFQNFILKNISINPANFEIFSFAIIKVHLEKFACKIYRDTRTASYDKGVDLSTDFGVIYQIKKLQLLNKGNVEKILSEIKLNIDSERLTDGKVVLIIDNISKNVKNYLINMKIQSISKDDIMNTCQQFYDVEDREKVLGIIYDEFRREYESQL